MDEQLNTPNEEPYHITTYASDSIRMLNKDTHAFIDSSWFGGNMVLFAGAHMKESDQSGRVFPLLV